MPRRVSVFFVASACLLLLLAGCARTEGVILEPLPIGGGNTELRLGPGVRAMSEGPGYKSSPAWKPDGGRLAFVVDGYVVDIPANGGGQRRWTERDLGAQAVGWNTDSSLSVTLRPGQSEPGEDADGEENLSPGEVKTSSVYRIPRPNGSPDGFDDVSEVAEDVIVSATVHREDSTGDEDAGSSYGSVIATRSGSGSLISALQAGSVARTYSQAISGLVTGISVSPDETKAVLSVRTSEADESSRYELRILDLVEGTSTDIVTLEPGRYIPGSPQWSSEGIYYLAGDETEASPSSPAETTTGTYATTQRLFLLQDGPNGPSSEPAPGPGSGFTASNIRLSPDGDELAMIGRLRSDSPANVYSLNLENSELLPLTENEDMEIKNGPDDLAWSPDGDYLAIVARGIPPVGVRVYPAPASSLLEAFYNVYRVPVEQ